MPANPACIACGYSLAGLPREALCPECAFPIARSLDATPLLRTAEPRWLRGLWFGFRLLRLAMVAWLAALIAILPTLCITLLTLSFRTGPDGPPWLQVLTAIVGFFIAACFGIGLLILPVGLWFITAPTHGPHAARPGDRILLRALGIPLALMPIILLLITPVWRFTFLPQPGILACRAAVQAAGLAALFALGRAIVHFHRGTPDPPPDLFRRARNFRRNLIALAIIFIIGWLMLLVTTTIVFTMPLGFAPILLALLLMNFDGDFRRLRDAVNAERAAAAGPS